MADLKLDSRLHDLFRDLLIVSNNFESADYSSKKVAGAVGHDGLEGKVRDFATKWDDRRPKIIASVDTLWKSAQAIEKTFGDLDRSMGDQMSQKG